MDSIKEEILLKFSLNNLSQNKKTESKSWELCFLVFSKRDDVSCKFFFIFCRFRILMQKSWCYKLVIPTFILKDFSQNLEDIVQFNSVAQSCLALCNPMNCSMPGLPVHHQLLESTQTHVHWVGDAIQPYHPLPSPSPPALNLSQHQGLFKCGGCYIQCS